MQDRSMSKKEKLQDLAMQHFLESLNDFIKYKKLDVENDGDIEAVMIGICTAAVTLAARNDSSENFVVSGEVTGGNQFKKEVFEFELNCRLKDRTYRD